MKMIKSGKAILTSFVTICLFAVLTLSVALAQSVRINTTHAVVNVTITSGEVTAAVSRRGFLLIINDSDVVMYCAVSVAAVMNRGIRLNAEGGSYEMSRGIRNLDKRAVNCIHGGSGNKVMTVTKG